LLQVIRLEPNLPDPYHTLGLLHEAVGDVKKVSTRRQQGLFSGLASTQGGQRLSIASSQMQCELIIVLRP
jgi:hypothetical protein